MKTEALTIWVDLTVGKEQLWAKLHKQFRYDIRRSKKLGVVVEKSKSYEDILTFYKVYERLSARKNFSLVTSPELMINLLQQHHSPQMDCYLFVAKHEGNFCGGAFVLRCGEHIHYMWGALDHSFSHLSIGEALQWAVIEWALDENCKRYDLEGITPKQNSGADYFKRKIGGELVSNPGIQTYSLNPLGWLISGLLKISLSLPKLKDFNEKLKLKINKLHLSPYAKKGKRAKTC